MVDITGLERGVENDKYTLVVVPGDSIYFLAKETNESVYIKWDDAVLPENARAYSALIDALLDTAATFANQFHGVRLKVQDPPPPSNVVNLSEFLKELKLKAKK
jgi:hypothetical protein